MTKKPVYKLIFLKRDNISAPFEQHLTIEDFSSYKEAYNHVREMFVSGKAVTALCTVHINGYRVNGVDMWINRNKKSGHITVQSRWLGG